MSYRADTKVMFIRHATIQDMRKSKGEQNENKSRKRKSPRNRTTRKTIQRRSLSKNPRLPHSIPRLRLQQNGHGQKQRSKLPPRAPGNTKTRGARPDQADKNGRPRPNVQAQHGQPSNHAIMQVRGRDSRARSPENCRSGNRKRRGCQTANQRKTPNRNGLGSPILFLTR